MKQTFVLVNPMELTYLGQALARGNGHHYAL